MRESLTYLAIGLILALTAALFAPVFVSWSDFRATIEAQLSKSLGSPVSTAGPIKLRFLPTPQIRLGVVAVGERTSGPWLRADGFSAELGLTSLMRGEIRLTDATFVRPLLELNADAEGQLPLPLSAGATGGDAEGGVRLEHFSVQDGTLVIRRPDGELRLPGLTFDGEAQSLAGPFNVRGVVAVEGSGAAPVKFSLATGAPDRQRIRFKLGSDVPAIGGRAEVDGALIRGEGKSPASFEGTAVVSGTGLGPQDVVAGVAATGLAWKLTGALTADLNSAVLQNLELRAGEGDRGLSAGGQARLTLGDEPHAEIRLDARQFDLDKLGLLPAGEASAAAVLEALLAYIRDDRRLQPLPMPVDFALTASVVSLGKEAVSDLDLKIYQEAGRQTQVTFAANGPGRSSMLLKGVVEPGIAAKFNGDIAVLAPDAARLEAWFNGAGNAGAWRRPDALADYKSISVSGFFELAATGFAGRDLTVALDRTTYNGTLVHTLALGDEREKVYADFTSEAIDLDALPDFSGVPEGAAGLDFSVALSARSARIARAGEGVLEVGRIAGKLTKTGDSIALEQLTLANVSGAAVSAAGVSNAKGSHIEARVDAAQLTDVAALARRLAPGAWSDALAQRAPQLGNARLIIKADASPSTGNGPPALTLLSLDGLAGATRIAAFAKPEGPGSLAISLVLDAPDAAPLLRQLGLPATGGAGAGAARISLAARRRGDQFETISADANVSGTALTYRGGTAQGKATLKSANIAPLLQALGLAAADAGKTAAGAAGEAATDIAIVAGGFEAQKLAGNLAGTKFEGRLSYRFSVPGDSAAVPESFVPRLTGALSLGRTSLAGLASLSLGPMPEARAGATWPDTAFGTGLAYPPPSEISVTAAAFDLSSALPGRDAAMLLQLSPGKMSVEDFTVSAGGGKIAGRFDLRRDGPVAALAGRLALDGIALTQATLKGRMSGTLDFATTGDSPLALISGLAGSGEASFAPLQINGFDPLALKRLLEAAEAEKIVTIDQSVTLALSNELDRAALTSAILRTPVSLAAGTARFGPVLLAETPARAEASATLDLRSLELDLRATLAALSMPKFWNGAPPQAAASWKGIWPHIERRVDATALVNGLAAAAILRDSERLAAVDADIRERAFFNRRLKAAEQERERERQRLIAEQLALEEDKRRAIEAARALSDQQRRQGQDQPRTGVPPPAMPLAPAPPHAN